MSMTKRVARAMIPNSVLVARRRLLLKKTADRFTHASNAEIFSTVYADQMWGEAEDGFSSGDGSHDAQSYRPYVTAVGEFLSSLQAKPDAVDLGCGDFNVGRLIRPFCAGYIACDVVPALIERNRSLPDASDVDFRCVDIVEDDLPPGEVVMIRQVLQHLSNADVARVVAKLPQYRYAIITDHQPAGSFVPNADIPSGPHVRVGIGSALDLAEPPFSLQFAQARELCVVPGDGGVIRTTVYTLR